MQGGCRDSRWEIVEFYAYNVVQSSVLCAMIFSSRFGPIASPISFDETEKIRVNGKEKHGMNSIFD